MLAAASPVDARPQEIEEPSNRWLVHPLARALLRPALALGLAPNTVSLTGAAFGVAAGLAYTHWRDWRLVLLGLMLMLGWHVCDGLDGMIARATGKASAFGRLIDGACDYVVFIAVLIPLALSTSSPRQALALAIVGGGFHAVQAAWFEGARETWRRRVAGRFSPEARPATGHWLEWGHNRMEIWLGGGVQAVDAALAKSPERLAAYRAATAPILRLATPLSANGRTFAIALACLAGDPRYYWVWEIVGLTVLAVAVEAALRRRARLAVMGQAW